MDQEIEKKNLVLNSVHTRPEQEKSEKNRKELKHLLLALFLANTICDRPKKRTKILVPNSVHIQPGQENSEKNRKKNKKN